MLYSRSYVQILILFLFFFTATATTEIYTLSLHDALPISTGRARRSRTPGSTTGWRSASRTTATCTTDRSTRSARSACSSRSEEHTSELQSQFHLVCRLLLEKKKKILTYQQQESTALVASN